MGDDLIDSEFTSKEVGEAIRNLKNGKTGGSDGIANEVFKGLEGIGEDILAKLFTEIYDKGNIPDDWKEAEIVPIFKKGDNADVNNYRRVSLNNGLYKVFTYIVNERMKKWVKNNQS